MGVKHFFYWFSKNYNGCVETLRRQQRITSVEVDVLALDLNSIFHPVAQRVFEYGEHTPIQSLLLPGKGKDTPALRLKCYEEIGKVISELVFLARPRKRLFLCVDGVAGLGKINQQRQRRFKSAKDRENEGIVENAFDGNCITPGTRFMHYLNQYLEWLIHVKMMSGEWAHLDIIFSSEKVPGEGEHCAIQLFKRVCDPNEKMMIFGPDADLIMLCLATQLPHIYIYRDNMFNPEERFVVNISQFAENLKQDLGTKSAVIDFIFICFLVGNDFLPQIPSLEILNDGLEILLEIYKKTCRPFGLIHAVDYSIRIQTFLAFCSEIAKLEESILQNKYERRDGYNPDELLETYFTPPSDFEGYRRAYYEKKLSISSREEVQNLCVEYVRGLQWVIQYYCIGIPSWLWCYPRNYSPFLTDICQGKYKIEPFSPTQPLSNLEQLLSVLPPQSSKLLPRPLRPIITTHPDLRKYYPRTFSIDVSGKRANWEGIVDIPTIDVRLLRRIYDEYKTQIPIKDLILNEREENKRYRLPKRGKKSKQLITPFGTIERCYVELTTFL